MAEQLHPAKQCALKGSAVWMRSPAGGNWSVLGKGFCTPSRHVSTKSAWKKLSRLAGRAQKHAGRRARPNGGARYHISARSPRRGSDGRIAKDFTVRADATDSPKPGPRLTLKWSKTFAYSTRWNRFCRPLTLSGASREKRVQDVLRK